MLQLNITTKDPDHAALCELYWQLDSKKEFVYTINEIAELANIDPPKVTSIVKKSCQASTKSRICSGCFKPLVFFSRSDFRYYGRSISNSSENPTYYLCDSCRTLRKEAEEEAFRKQIEIGENARKKAQEELRRKIQKTYDLSKRQPINIEELSLTDTIYLISILRGAYEELTKIKPISLFEQPLSPEQVFSSEIINYLFSRGLIYLHPDTDPNGFKDSNLSVFYVFEVTYAPPISSTSQNNTISLINSLLKHLNKEWTQEWCHEALLIWKKVAISECKEYLRYALKEHHFEFTPGNKTTQYLEFSLEHFSTAQVFNTIWRSVKDAAAYYQRTNITKIHATNIAIASIQRITERAIIENWSIKPFGRNFNCPQSCVSDVLYNLALKVGDVGFQTMPNNQVVYNLSKKNAEKSD